MAKTEMIRARVEPDLKEEAERIFSTLGLSPAQAITLFYRQVALCRGLPFEARIPNEKTLEAIRQAHTGERLTRYSSFNELMAELDEA